MKDMARKAHAKYPPKGTPLSGWTARQVLAREILVHNTLDSVRRWRMPRLPAGYTLLPLGSLRPPGYMAFDLDYPADHGWKLGVDSGRYLVRDLRTWGLVLAAPGGRP